MKFSDLTEDQWGYIKCFLPPQPRVGRKRAEDRKTINGILYVLETGCSGKICLDAMDLMLLPGEG